MFSVLTTPSGTYEKLWMVGTCIELNKTLLNLPKLEVCISLLHYFDSFNRKLDTNFHQYHDVIS